MLPRPLWRWLAILLLVAATPSLAYEALQKASELAPGRHPLLRLSARAEGETRWRGATGVPVLDHVVHEWEETRRFYRLARRRLDEPRQRGRWW